MAGHGVSALLESVETLAVSRTVAGIGEGCALAVANAIIVASSDSQRNFGVMTGVNIVFGMLFLALLSLVERHYSVWGVFGALALVCLVLMLPLNFIDDVTTGNARVRSSGLKNTASYSLLTAMFLWGTASAAMWAFTIQIAQSTDLEPHQISFSITTWAIGGVAGSGLAAMLSKVPNKILPLLLILILYACCAMVLTHSSTGIVYLIFVPVFVSTVYFVLPYMLAVAAEIDPQGGCATAVGGMFMVTGATGPVFGGILVQLGGFEYMGWSVMVLAALSVPLIFHAARGAETRIA